jgi:hypothetical protein
MEDEEEAYKLLVPLLDTWLEEELLEKWLVVSLEVWMGLRLDDELVLESEEWLDGELV